MVEGREIMRPITLVLLTAIALSPMFLSSPTFAQSCISGLKQNRLQMMSLADQCNVNASLMGALEAGEIPPDQGACGRPLSVNAQNEAFNECARVYLCAVRAYNCAIQRAEAGEDCQSAAGACLQEYRVPQ